MMIVMVPDTPVETNWMNPGPLISHAALAVTLLADTGAGMDTACTVLSNLGRYLGVIVPAAPAP